MIGVDAELLLNYNLGISARDNHPFQPLPPRRLSLSSQTPLFDLIP